MSGLEGSIVVTGGTGSLGSAVVEELLSSGVRVVATWVVEAERERIEAELGGRGELELVEADLLTEGGADGAVEAAMRRPPLSALVNLVGGYAQGGRCHECPPDEMERMFQLNVMTTYWASRAAIPAMLDGEGGSIVCIGAKAAIDPFSGASGYITAKDAVIEFVRALAVEYRDDGIRANVVLPSVIDTPANRAQMPDADHSKWVPPAQIARVIRFLCSDDAEPISGASIPVYGRAG
jgi:NAD(P)-dependent dehydrogenase (short-subunit alcohol dehydrogenase family)